MENEIVNQNDEQLITQISIQVEDPIIYERKSRLDCCCLLLARSIIYILVFSGILVFIGGAISIYLIKRQ